MTQEQMSTTEFIRWMLWNVGPIRIVEYTDWIVRCSFDVSRPEKHIELVSNTFDGHVVVSTIDTWQDQYGYDIRTLAVTYRR